MIQSQLPSYRDFGIRGNKSIPEYFKNEVLKALSFFPELEHTSITFQLSKKTAKHIMHTHVSLSSLLFNKHKRAYTIIISNNFYLQNAEIRMSFIPKDVLIGWLGVELAKILAYESISTYQLLTEMFSYQVSKEFVKKKELKANRCAKKRMKTYVPAARKFIIDKSNLPLQVVEKVNTMYTSPALIVNFINAHSAVKKTK
ncbi:hypothetical protein [Kordia jejudonensis]|uniref:hypothetical protein n=1 Tax=Kordia jejudonensis TaxID=1348245 RepID=UPI00069B82D3|nr:hypothetical protein [Kordia jejudonensis]